MIIYFQPGGHIVYAEEGLENGVFDLRDPESLVRMGLFIRNIREDLEKVISKLESAVPNLVDSITEHGLMQWRADTTPKSLNEERITPEDLFSAWVDRAEPIEDQA